MAWNRLVRPGPHLVPGGLLVVVVASVLTTQVVLLRSQTRVLARQEQVLREREAKVDRMNDLASRILESMDKLAEAQKDAAVKTAKFERVPAGEQPIVILPSNE